MANFLDFLINPEKLKKGAGFLAEGTIESALGGKAGGELFAYSKALQGVDVLLGKITDKVKIGGEDFSLLGSIKYWDGVLGKMNETNRTLGIAGQLGLNLKGSFREAYASVIEMGISSEELAKSVQSFYEKSGRAQLLSANEMSELAKMADVFGAESLDIVETYREVGLGVTATTTRMRNLIKESDKFGVLPTKVSSILKNNIDAVNKYNFKNGVSALEKMAIYAAKTNTDMKGAFAMADKILEGGIEGAMEMSASLQLLGGSFGNMGQMSELIYIARNEPEKFQEMFENAAAGMAELNEQTGEITFNAEARQRLRAVAKETGQDFEDLMKQGRSLKKSLSIGEELDSSVKGLSNYEEMLTKVSGAARKNALGEWVVNLKKDGKEIETAVSALTEDTIKQISFTDETKGPEAAFEKIATSNETLNQTMQRLIDTLKVEAISTGAFEKFNVMAREAADNVKEIAKPFIENIKNLIEVGTANMQKVAEPLSQGNFEGAMNAAGENLAEAGNAMLGLTKDVGQMLFNIFANAAKFLAAGIEWGFRKGMNYIGNALIGLYNMTFGQAFGLADTYKSEDVNFAKILESYDLKGVMSGTSFENWWNDLTGTKAAEGESKKTNTPVQNTGVPEPKKAPENMEKDLSAVSDKKISGEIKHTGNINFTIEGKDIGYIDNEQLNRKLIDFMGGDGAKYVVPKFG